MILDRLVRRGLVAEYIKIGCTLIILPVRLKIHNTYSIALSNYIHLLTAILPLKGTDISETINNPPYIGTYNKHLTGTLLVGCSDKRIGIVGKYRIINRFKNLKAFFSEAYLRLLDS